jgi:peptidyl-tRNA hydrolase
MYFLVNVDLKMGSGKIAGQVGHAACEWTRRLERALKLEESIPNAMVEHYRVWLANHEPKIVLKSSADLMKTMLREYPSKCIPIYDLGRTQVAPMSMTVVAFAPAPPDQLPKEISGLKLL